MRRRKPGSRTIVYFHGNAGTLGDRHERVLAYLQRGYGVLLVGYRGYGGNPGEPTEAGLYDDGRAHLDWLAAQGLRPDELVLYGESLGCGGRDPAGDRAQGRPPWCWRRRLPRSCLSARARYPLFAFDWVVKDKFANIDKIDTISMPLFVIHGALDRVTPQRFGRMVFDARARAEGRRAGRPVRATTTCCSSAWSRAVTRFLDGLPRRSQRPADAARFSASNGSSTQSRRLLAPCTGRKISRHCQCGSSAPPSAISAARGRAHRIELRPVGAAAVFGDGGRGRLAQQAAAHVMADRGDVAVLDR